jgi:perosamine synthetase
MTASTKDFNPSKYLGNEFKYLEKVLEGESWSATGGSWTTNLEKEFAKKFGAKYAVAFNSGTSTLHAGLEAAGVGPGDEVISPALTVIMNTTATLYANAIPVYADIDPGTFNIDPKDVGRRITPKTKAIMVVSLYGLPADMDPILDLAKKYNLIVIEDNAQCVLSTYKGKLTGTIGHIASYSFENTKHISCGEGGMIITNNEQYAEIARKIGGHGFKNLKAEEGRIRLTEDVFQNPNYKRHDILGWNYRLSEFNAAVALAQLERVEALIDLRVKSAKMFMDVMASCDYLIPQNTPEGYTNSFYTLAVKYEGKESIGVSWEDFRRAYISEGGDGFYGAWSVPYLEPMVAERQFVKRCPWVYENIFYEKGLCPVAEEVQPKIMQFKTNYRDTKLAEMKAYNLNRVIKKFQV